MRDEEKETALVVDDNADVLLATASLLESMGFNVCEADGPTAAIAAFQQQRFDLVVSDIHMPGNINGIELAEILRRSYAELPIVLMTGFTDLLKEGRDKFVVLSKPFGAADLQEAIRSAVSK